MATRKAPIERALEIWSDARPLKKGWYEALCTGHNDTNPSLNFIENDNGTIGFHCWSHGCTREQIIEGAKERGLKPGELYPKGGYRPKYRPRPMCELIPLAADKLLPWQFLFNLGVEDGYKYETKKGNIIEVVRIRYYNELGEEYSKVRLRSGLSGHDSFWDEHTPGYPIPYGLHKLAMAREKGYLVIGEGESDAWTCWFYDIPFLGVPGASNAKYLDGSLLCGIPVVYVIQEPDQAGQNFYRDVHKQLRATGYTGEMLAAPWKKLTSYKDPNEMHRMTVLRGRD